jgi:hypothetical protein
MAELPQGAQKSDIPMIGTEFLRETVETVIMTGKVRDVAPVSLLIIAAPESGKTSIVLEKQCEAIKAYADVTGRGLHSILKYNTHLTHIVINDLVATLSHRQSVNRYTISQLNSITEEGITAIATPAGEENFECGKKGVIASLTLELAQDARRWWNKVGFSSRMLPFCYIYSDDLLLKIKASIDESRGKHKELVTKNGNGEFRIPKEPVGVTYKEEIAKHVRQVADVRSQVLEEQGMRRLKQYHGLIQAHALLRTRTKPAVNDDDLEYIYKLDKFVSYDKPQILS